MIKLIKFTLLIFSLYLSNSFADITKQQQHKVQQTLNLLKDSLNQHQYNIVTPYISEDFSFQGNSGEMGLMILQQIVNQYPKTIDSIEIKSITKEDLKYKVTTQLMFAKESETKEIILDDNYKILQANIVNIQVAGHQSTKNISKVKNSNKIEKFISPFKQVGRLILVEAQVNGIQGDFMVDTGAMSFVLNSKKFPELLKSAKEDEKQAYGVGGKVENQKTVMVESFKWQSLELLQINTNIWDLTQLEESIGHPLTGIIGADMLSQFIIEFDYNNKQLVLMTGDPIKQWKQAPDETLDFKMISHIPAIEVKVADTKLLFGIDSGAEGAMLMTRWELALSKQYEFIKNDTLNGIDGNKKITKFVKLNEFTAGEQSYKDHQFIIADIQWGHESIIDGLLGYEFLSSRRTAIDFKNQKIYFWN